MTKPYDSAVNKATGRVKTRRALLNAIADYMYNSGCGCCGDKEAMREAEQRLGKLLRVPKYKDGSGYDFSKFRTRSGG